MDWVSRLASVQLAFGSDGRSPSARSRCFCSGGFTGYRRIDGGSWTPCNNIHRGIRSLDAYPHAGYRRPIVERLSIARLGTRGDGVAGTPAGPLYAPYTLPGETGEFQQWPGHA